MAAVLNHAQIQTTKAMTLYMTQTHFYAPFVTAINHSSFDLIAANADT
jgi:chromosomal replication initiation ATPase DnaA